MTRKYHLMVEYLAQFVVFLGKYLRIENQIGVKQKEKPSIRLLLLF
jgi:hypothetical protein